MLGYLVNIIKKYKMNLQLIAFMLHLIMPCMPAEISWTKESFPNPQLDTSQCGRDGIVSRVCDPGNILSSSAGNVLHYIIVYYNIFW